MRAGDDRMERLESAFFQRDCLEVAPELVGKLLVRRDAAGERWLRITETEAYRGEEDTACHAHKGRTRRTEVLYGEAGTMYVYLCYGMHWLLNVVTGDKEQPQAVLIRACEGAEGPGKLTKALSVTGEFNRQHLDRQDALFIADDGKRYPIIKDKRVGIGYASPQDQERLWRFRMGGLRADT